MNKHRFDSVWDVLEDTSEGAENMKVRGDLMEKVQEFVRTLGVTQAAF